MKQKAIFKELEKILDNWDPIGILQNVKPINYVEDTIGEYTMYISSIIEVYLSNQSVYDYLIKLQTDLVDNPGELMKEKIKIVAEKIVKLLSQYKKEDLQEIC